MQQLGTVSKKKLKNYFYSLEKKKRNLKKFLYFYLKANL